MSDKKNMVLPFLIGAAAGATAALLLAGKTGPELRESIGDGFDTVKGKVTGAIGDRLDTTGARLRTAGESLQSMGAKMQS